VTKAIGKHPWSSMTQIFRRCQPCHWRGSKAVRV